MAERMNMVPHSTESLQLARETRERFVAAIEDMIRPAALAIREWLMNLAYRGGAGLDVQQSQDDFAVFQERGSNWVALARERWSRALVDMRAVRTDPQALQRLELVEDVVVENRILAARLAQVIQDVAGPELHVLRLRIQALEGSTELDARDVLRPEVLAQVLVDQWLVARLSRALWVKIQDVLVPLVFGAVQAASRDVNAFLVGQGVMPEISLKDLVRHGQDMEQPASAVHRDFPATTVGIAERGAGVVAPQGSPFSLARQRAQEMLDHLRRFVTVRIGRDLTQPAAAVGVAGRQRLQSSSFATAIDETQAACQAVLQHLAGESAAALRQALHELNRHASDLKRRAPTIADKAMVEIVALMFQSILVEERLPFSIRVWFARLQMPVLRVALAEPEFFASPQHPARLLIDRMGACVMGFDPAVMVDSALEAEIRRGVQVIEQYPESGQRVFQLVYQEFTDFLSRHLTQAETTQRVMSVAQQVEQKETMAIQYSIELRRMLNGVPVCDAIRDFLFKVWADVLALASLRYGARNLKTAAFKSAAADLMWAASAKPLRLDRVRVIQMLPGLLQRLRQGMALLGVVGEPQDEHIRCIGHALTDAFMSKTQTIPVEQIDGLAKRLARLESYISDESVADLLLERTSIELLLGEAAAALTVLPDTGARAAEGMREWAQALEVGQWFALIQDAAVGQIQFVWRSPRGQLYLFAAADGRSFLIQAGRLASCLQTGMLAPIEKEALTARATRETLARLDANPERLFV